MRRKPSQTKSIVYRNKKFGFAIVFPRWWKSYIAVNRKPYGSPEETFISFRFRYKGKVYEPVFTIDISNLTGNAWKRQFNDTPVIFLSQHEGLTYGYILPGEVPDAFLRPDQQDYDYVRYGRQIRILKKLVAQAPKVLKTLHFFAVPKSKVACCRSSRLRRKKNRHTK